MDTTFRDILDTEWKMHRKLLNPTIQNFNILNSFYPTFNRNMRIMIDRMQERCGQGEFDAYGPMEACSLDMICGWFGHLNDTAHMEFSFVFLFSRTETTFGIKMHVQDGQNMHFLEHANK